MGSDNELFEKVKGIIVEQLGANAEAVKMEASFIDDLGADSLDAVELCMTIEEAFDITIPEDKIADLKTVKDIVEFVESQI